MHGKADTMTQDQVSEWYPVTTHMVSPVYCGGFDLDSGNWNLHFINPPRADRDVIVILNGEQQHNISTLREMWVQAAMKVVVDGGANYIYDQVGHKQDEMIPDLCTGDFDSIRKNVLNFYKNKESCRVINTPDENETDFMKCIRIVAAEILAKDLQVDRILVFGAYGGRLDHVFANVNVLLMSRQFLSQSIYLLSETQQAFLLSEGKHTIYIQDKSLVSWCGLVPISSGAKVSTTGLRWNLDKRKALEYGKLISTSNRVSSDEVHIECDNHIVWMMGYNDI